jgi:hypothetical protein
MFAANDQAEKNNPLFGEFDPGRPPPRERINHEESTQGDASTQSDLKIVPKVGTEKKPAPMRLKAGTSKRIRWMIHSSSTTIVAPSSGLQLTAFLLRPSTSE